MYANQMFVSCALQRTRSVITGAVLILMIHPKHSNLMFPGSSDGPLLRLQLVGDAALHTVVGLAGKEDRLTVSHLCLSAFGVD